jgi:hypothetical protein
MNKNFLSKNITIKILWKENKWNKFNKMMLKVESIKNRKKIKNFIRKKIWITTSNKIIKSIKSQYLINERFNQLKTSIKVKNRSQFLIQINKYQLKEKIKWKIHQYKSLKHQNKLKNLLITMLIIITNNINRKFQQIKIILAIIPQN